MQERISPDGPVGIRRCATNVKFVAGDWVGRRRRCFSVDSIWPGAGGTGEVVGGHRPHPERLPGRGAGRDPGGQIMTGTRVQVIPKGPVLVSGPVRIEVPGGRVVESDRFMVAICTCARSK